MNSKFSSTKVVHKITGERCVGHMVSPFDETKTNCGLKIGTLYKTGAWSQNIWTSDFAQLGFTLGEDCARCARTETSPCESTPELSLQDFAGKRTVNHKMFFNAQGIALICVKCGKLAN